MKPISTKLHGILDYATAGALLALPRLAGWNGAVRGLLTGAALGTTAYSLLTRYELGAVKVLPMKAHLALDCLQGVTLLAAPCLLLTREAPAVKRALLGLGVFELAVSLLTRSEAPPEERPVEVAADRWRSVGDFQVRTIELEPLKERAAGGRFE